MKSSTGISNTLRLLARWAAIIVLRFVGELADDFVTPSYDTRFLGNLRGNSDGDHSAGKAQYSEEFK